VLAAVCVVACLRARRVLQHGRRARQQHLLLQAWRGERC
jgi:hypothetical protein